LGFEFDAVTCQEKVSKNVIPVLNLVESREKLMTNKQQSGFSLIELLLVVVIIGIIAAVAIPALQKGVKAAENGSTVGIMRTIASSQLNFYSTNNRFARLAELNNNLGNGLGTVSGDQILRGRYTFDMVPATPTDPQLRDSYTITATRSVTGNETLYKYQIDQSGKITRIFPAGELDN
jgi:prepilin-type N-terminal cleavage/methylation domain-containing protein